VCSKTVSIIFHQNISSIHNYSKEWFCKCRGYHSLRLKQSSNRIWLKNSSEIKGNFSHWCRVFSKIAFYESFWGNICGGFVWANTASVAFTEIDLEAGGRVQSSMYNYKSINWSIAFMRKNKNAVCVVFICSRPFIITELQWLQPDLRILIIF